MYSTVDWNSKMGSGGATTLGKAGFMLAIVALLVHVVGMSTPYWIRGDSSHYSGIWQACIGEFCVATDTSLAYLSAVKAMEMLAVLAGFGGVVLIFLQMVVESMKTNYVVKTLGKVALLAAALFGLIGVVIFGVKGYRLAGYFHWSFGLTIVGSILYGVAGILLFVDGRSH